MEATGNEALVPELQVIETHLKVKSNFAMLGIPQASNATTGTATTASNKAVADKKREIYKDDNKAGKYRNQNTRERSSSI